MSSKWLQWVSDYTFAKWYGYENPGLSQTSRSQGATAQTITAGQEIRPKQETSTAHGDYKIITIPAKVEQYTYQRATSGAFLLDVSGLVHDENGGAEIDHANPLMDTKRGEAYKTQGTENLIEVRLASGGVHRFPCYFGSFKAESHPSHLVNHARFRWNAILPAMENAVGYRLIELKNGLEIPVAEQTFDTLKEPELNIRLAPKNVVEWRVWPRNSGGAIISWDQGNTWEAPKGVGGYIELPLENLQQNPEPWIEFEYSLNFRLTRKTYQVGKGFIQAPLSTGFTIQRAETTAVEF